LNELISYWRKDHASRGYQEIRSPLLNKKELYETSGHWQHYKEEMFISQTDEKEIYGLKPMNCPNAMVIFGMRTRSYRELPLRLSDTDILHRFERSGTLNGLLRVREFSQDDAHIFIAEDNIKKEYENILEIADHYYKLFNLDYSFRLGTRPEKFMGDKKVWDKAEKILEDVLKETNKKYIILDGDGAFYGPKIDILMKDSLGREWQTGTIQLDFQQPEKFELKYNDKDGQVKSPIVIHRVIYGSLERFMGILIEHLGGEFPVWLAPVQVKLLPVSDQFLAYTKEIASKLEAEDIRVEIDESNESVGKKVRTAELQKVPFYAVIGQKEADSDKLATKIRDTKQQEVYSLTELIDMIKEGK